MEQRLAYEKRLVRKREWDALEAMNAAKRARKTAKTEATRPPGRPKGSVSGTKSASAVTATPGGIEGVRPVGRPKGSVSGTKPKSAGTEGVRPVGRPKGSISKKRLEAIRNMDGEEGENEKQAVVYDAALEGDGPASLDSYDAFIWREAAARRELARTWTAPSSLHPGSSLHSPLSAIKQARERREAKVNAPASNMKCFAELRGMDFYYRMAKPKIIIGCLGHMYKTIHDSYGLFSRDCLFNMDAVIKPSERGSHQNPRQLVEIQWNVRVNGFVLTSLSDLDNIRVGPVVLRGLGSSCTLSDDCVVSINHITFGFRLASS
jgi:hypothetical protein